MNITTASLGYLALRENVAQITVSARGRFRMTGEDRARLLHAMTTNNIQALQPGQGCYAFFLNAQGRILADAVIWCFEDRLLVETEPEQRAKIYEHLDRYIIADDVTLEDITAQTEETFIEGPEAESVLTQLGAPIPEGIWSHLSWNGGTIQRRSTGFSLLFPKGATPSLADLPEANADEARIVRMEQGRPRYGEEITERYLVQETGLMDAVSFSKGCYLGQEIVERVRSRGQVHRLLRSIEIDTENPPAPGDKLTADGAAAGEIVSAAYSPALEKIVAMAYVRTSSASPGTSLMIDGFNARVLGAARL